ncbi:hypothetical protein A3SI_08861 [Nitritalea halalkaliphila LW7]|uniref:Outer membrane protein beta-barrel domain-containing protein n=1 Tax=Nitritalea halalkaliphila LW7 TaxID=1189621 RepID=I5C4P7_9BACT|nr:hypothetical protein [Nitritalea halalkaliphila]EIM76799.1 hypothetical protein A3SI_08861 [Nitritalea halalkaliphila LW7]
MKKILFFALILIGVQSTQQLQAQKTRNHMAYSIGGSYMYGNNTGDFSTFTFTPSIVGGITYNRQLSERMDFRVNAFGQHINSGGHDRLGIWRTRQWEAMGLPFDFRGFGLGGDIMPTYNFHPNKAGQVGSSLNVYMGLGVGFLNVWRVEQLQIENTIVKRNASTAAAYIPFRIGVNTNFDFEWDYAIELGLLTSTSDLLDGNDFGNKSLPVDMLVQLQFKVIRYIGVANRKASSR